MVRASSKWWLCIYAHNPSRLCGASHTGNRGSLGMGMRCAGFTASSLRGHNPLLPGLKIHSPSVGIVPNLAIGCTVAGIAVDVLLLSGRGVL